MTEDTFTCAACNNTYKRERTDEEALEEAKELFGESVTAIPVAVVCEDCHQRLITMWGVEINETG